MKITKEGLRSLVREMIQAEKGLIRESKVTNPIRRIIKEELRLLREGYIKTLRVSDLKKLKDGKGIIVKGFKELDYTVSKSSRIQMEVFTELPQMVEPKTQSFIDQYLAPMVTDNSITNGTYIISQNDDASKIQKIVSKWGKSEGAEVKQKLKIIIPEGINLIWNGKMMS